MSRLRDGQLWIGGLKEYMDENFIKTALRVMGELGRVLNFKCLKRPPRQVDVVSCVGLDYQLEKLRRSLCYAGDIITPLQQPCYGLLRRRRRF